jgi:hypothetical protein
MTIQYIHQFTDIMLCHDKSCLQLHDGCAHMHVPVAVTDEPESSIAVRLCDAQLLPCYSSKNKISRDDQVLDITGRSSWGANNEA